MQRAAPVRLRVNAVGGRHNSAPPLQAVKPAKLQPPPLTSIRRQCPAGDGCDGNTLPTAECAVVPLGPRANPGSSRLPAGLSLAAEGSAGRDMADSQAAKPMRPYSGTGHYSIKLPEDFIWDPAPCSAEEWAARPVGFSIKGRNARTLQYQRGVNRNGRNVTFYLCSAARPWEVGPDPTHGDLAVAHIMMLQAATYLASRSATAAPLLAPESLKQLEAFVRAGGSPPLLPGANAAPTQAAPAAATAGAAATNQPAGTQELDAMSASRGIIRRSNRFTLPPGFVWDKQLLSKDEWAKRPAGWSIRGGMLLEFHMRPSPSTSHYLGSIRRPDELLRGVDPTRGDLDAVRLIAAQGEAYERSGAATDAPNWTAISLARLDQYLAGGGSLIKSAQRKAGNRTTAPGQSSALPYKSEPRAPMLRAAVPATESAAQAAADMPLPRALKSSALRRAHRAQQPIAQVVETPSAASLATDDVDAGAGSNAVTGGLQN